MGLCNRVLENDVRDVTAQQVNRAQFSCVALDDLHKSHIEKKVWINEAAYIMERLVIDKILMEKYVVSIS